MPISRVVKYQNKPPKLPEILIELDYEGKTEPTYI